MCSCDMGTQTEDADLIPASPLLTPTQTEDADPIPASPLLTPTRPPRKYFFTKNLQLFSTNRTKCMNAFL